MIKVASRTPVKRHIFFLLQNFQFAKNINTCKSSSKIITACPSYWPLSDYSLKHSVLLFMFKAVLNYTKSSGYFY